MSRAFLSLKTLLVNAHILYFSKLISVQTALSCANCQYRLYVINYYVEALKQRKQYSSPSARFFICNLQFVNIVQQSDTATAYYPIFSTTMFSRIQQISRVLHKFKL
ncbi:unnamed protein product [Litomosoides sigmodontis]|uniref:Secreted protein n=1 Tax=Litomosoides sigmodontis TaxID=42156 RepID=A0A3P6UCN0_LITSI|nr:unnamed protein product [Litomosoides sigmodontis]